MVGREREATSLSRWASSTRKHRELHLKTTMTKRSLVLNHDRDAPISFCPSLSLNLAFFIMWVEICVQDDHWARFYLVSTVLYSVLTSLLSPKSLYCAPEPLLNFWDSTVSSQSPKSISDLMDFLIVSDEGKMTSHSGFDGWVETRHRLHCSPSWQQHPYAGHCV